MTAAKHTPGPWVVGSSDVPAIGMAICHQVEAREHSTVARLVKHGVESYAELEGNLHLIAAAPSLLAALRRLSFAAMARDTTMGDQCALFAAQAELRDASKQASEAIAMATKPINPETGE